MSGNSDCKNMENMLTHWGRVTHICVSNLTIIGSDNGLSPGRRQAIIWTNAGILLIGPLGTNFSENSIEILKFSFTKMRLNVSSAKWRPFCLGLNVLIDFICLNVEAKYLIQWQQSIRVWRNCDVLLWMGVLLMRISKMLSSIYSGVYT